MTVTARLKIHSEAPDVVLVGALINLTTARTAALRIRNSAEHGQ